MVIVKLRAVSSEEKKYKLFCGEVLHLTDSSNLLPVQTFGLI